MRIQHQAGDRLVLQGTPQCDQGVVLPVVVAAVFIAVGAILFPMTAGEHVALRTLTALPFVVGLVIASVIAWLLTRRERLVLDRTTDVGSYSQWSIMFPSKRRTDFELTHATGVTLARRVERTPHTGQGPQTIDVWEARMLIATPRIAVVLAAENTTRGDRTRQVAHATAEFLGLTLQTSSDVGD